MKRGFYRATFKVIDLLEDKIENEKTWMGQKGFALSSARMTNILRDLIGEIHRLEDEIEEDRKIFKLKVRG